MKIITDKIITYFGVYMIIGAIFYMQSATERPIIVSSLPKSGSHLLVKLIGAITGKKSITPAAITEINRDELPEKIGSNKFYFTHAVCTDDNASAALHNNAKVIVLLRDPRDVLPSYVYYLKKECEKPNWRGFFLEPDWAQFSHLSVKEMISHFIKRYPTKGPQIPEYETMMDLYSLYLKWKGYPDVYFTTFEKLVGPQGGGDAKIQEKEIMKIAKFINVPITAEKAKRICTKLFGKTATFRKGVIGSWKDELTSEHIAALKTMPGFNKLLIELGYEKDANW